MIEASEIVRPANSLAPGFAAIALALAGFQGTAQFPLPHDAAQDVTPSGSAFVEIRAQRSTYYVDEPIRVTLRFGFEEQLFTTNLVALFRPRMDVPVQLEAPWLAELPGATLQGQSDGEPAGAKSFVLNDALARARAIDVTRVDGRPFRAFEFERTLMATRAGALTLPEARLRFAYATRFGEGALQDPTAQDRAEAFVRGPALNLTILPLPDEGRPPGFSGAVGRLRLRTELGAREVEVGSSVKLALHIEGEGNLESFEAPRIGSAEGWRVLGSIERKRPEIRTIEYDLAPTNERTTRVPQLAFAYFDTTPPAGYRTLESEALTIEVRAAARPADERKPTEPSEPAASRPRTALYAAIIVVLLLAAVLERRRRSRGKKRASIR